MTHMWLVAQVIIHRCLYHCRTCARDGILLVALKGINIYCLSPVSRFRGFICTIASTYSWYCFYAYP